MIQRESFIRLIDAVLAQTDRESGLVKALEPYFDGHCVSEVSAPIRQTILDVLATETGDNNGIIEWWLFDAPEAGKNKSAAYFDVDDKYVPLKTPGQLYDWFIT